MSSNLYRNLSGGIKLSNRTLKRYWMSTLRSPVRLFLSIALLSVQIYTRLNDNFIITCLDIIHLRA